MKISLSLGIQTWNNVFISVSSFLHTWLSWHHTHWNQGEVWLDSYMRNLGRICFQAHSSWQNSILCGCRTKVPIFLLAVGWGSLSSRRGFSRSLRVALSSSAVENFSCVTFLSHFKSDFLFCYQVEKAFCF